MGIVEDGIYVDCQLVVQTTTAEMTGAVTLSFAGNEPVGRNKSLLGGTYTKGYDVNVVKSINTKPEMI